MKKTTIYIDIEDDIASIIDKIEASDEKIVALVLPKRPTTFQSSVNMSLLKESSDESSKSLVLVSTDQQVIRLAGQTGLYIAGSLQSKPKIPSKDTDTTNAEIDEVVEDVPPQTSTDPAQPDVYAGDTKIDLDTPIGELVGEDDAIELDNEDPIDSEDPEAAGTEKKRKKSMISVPNFASFRLRLGLGILVIVVLAGGVYWALAIAPKATVVITAEKSEVEGKLAVTASKDYQAVNAEKLEIPAIQKADTQKLTGTFAATGQKDIGEKAKGTVTFRNCEDSDTITIPSGTGISRGAYTFITQSAVTLEGGTFSGGGSVCTSDASAPVNVVASQSGDQYNLAAGNYTVAGDLGNVLATGGAMGGGTSKIVKVVTADDIEAAKTKVLASAADNVKGKLSEVLKAEGLIPIEDTFTSTEGAPSSSIPLSAEATSDPVLTIEVTSNMLGVRLTDIEPLIKKDILTKIDESKQRIYSSGLESALLKVTSLSGAVYSVTISSSAQIGPNLEPGTVASDIQGKKAGEAKQYLESLPGVSKADIRLSPFWVFSLPKASKTTVSINE